MHVERSRRSARALWVALLTVAGLALVPGWLGAADAAVFNVTGTADGTGPCSASSCPTLRSAVLKSNEEGGSNTINVPAGTYTLTLTPSGPDDGMTGDLHIEANVTIAGAGSGLTTIHGDEDRIFEIKATASAVTLSGLTMTGGGSQVFGGAVRSVGASLTLTDDSLVANTAKSKGFGGALDMEPSGSGTLAVTGSTFSSNVAADTETEGGGFGGAIMFEPHEAGTVTITNSTFDSNTAQSGSKTGGGFGGALDVEPRATGSLTVTGSTFSSNTAAAAGSSGGFGGAIMFEPGEAGTATITNSTFDSNTAQGGSEKGGGFGGAVMFEPASGSLTVTGSTFSSNTADAPAAGAGFGGAIMFGPQEEAGTLTLTNSTLTGNHANAKGFGGAIDLEGASSTATLLSDTIAANTIGSGTSGGGLENGGKTTARNTIISGNTAGAAANNCGNAPIVAGAHDIELGTTCGFDMNADPKLAPLAENGGPTETMALLAGSPAIDAGDSAFCPATDQRGVPRPQPQAGTCDIGAYESAFADLAVSQIASPSPVTVGATLTYQLIATNNGPDTATGVTFQDTLPAGATLISTSASPGSCAGSAPVSCSLGTLAPGASARVTIAVRPSRTGVATNTASVAGSPSDPNSANNQSQLQTKVLPASTTVKPPIVADVGQSHRSWREGTVLANFTRKHKRAPLGTTFSFTLNEQASVSLAFTQRVGGRKVKRKCVAQTRKNRRKPACQRVLPRAALSFTGHSGRNKVSFQGRISPSRKLPPGNYTLVITATNAAGHSTPRSISFTILK